MLKLKILEIRIKTIKVCFLNLVLWITANKLWQKKEALTLEIMILISIFQK